MERRLTTILAADIVGYGRLMAADEAGTQAQFKAHRKEFFEPRTGAHHWRVFKVMGDGILMEFGSVVDAVNFAVDFQRTMADRNVDVPEDRQVIYRIGINIGDVLVEGDDINGNGVIVASRLEALAEPGGIYLSRTVFDHVKGKIEVGFEDLGAQKVKNIPEPIEVYRVVLWSGSGRVLPRHRRRRTMLTGAAAVAAITLGLIGWYQPWQPTATPPIQGPESALRDRPSIAVLPFDNLSASADDDYFAEGMTDDLITDLAKISGLVVIARNTVFTYKDRAIDVRDVGRELGVRYVLEGSLRRAGNQLRINAQLIDSRTGSHLWADRFDRDASDIFAVQDEVIRHIVEVLAIQVSNSERARVERLPTKNLEAYDYYLRAEQAARTGSIPQLRAALHLYEKATEIDRAFARAFAAEARTEAYVMRHAYDDVLAFPFARKRAYEHAGRALELDPESAMPLSVLADLQSVDGRHEEALASARRAVAIAPGEAATHAALSLVLTYDGRHPEAISAFETALKLDPRLQLGARLDASMSYMLNGQAERAVELLEVARAEAANIAEVDALLAAAYALTGRMEEALVAAAESARLVPNLSLELLRVKLAHLRRSEDLERILDAMAKAGLQKWPFGFLPGSRERLTAEAIENIAIGRKWQGRLDGVGPGILQIDPGGALAMRTNTLFATGKAYVSGDTLCMDRESFTLGRTVCGPIYRNQDTSAAAEFPFTYVNANMIFHFAPRE